VQGFACITHGFSFSGARGKRIIPVLIESCQVPEILRYITCCNYIKLEVREWFWPRLAKSVAAPLDPKERFSNKNSLLSSVNLDTSLRLDWENSTSSSYLSMMSQSSNQSSMSSNQSSMSSNQSSMASTDYTANHDYLDFPPASPNSERKSNDYIRASKLQKDFSKQNKKQVEAVKDQGHKQNNLTTPNDFMYSRASDGSPIPPPRSPSTLNRNRAPDRRPQTNSTRTASNIPPPLPPRGNSRTIEKKSVPAKQEYFC